MIKRRTSLKRHKRPNQVSKSKSSMNRSIKKTYEEMSLENEHICTGCGSGYNLTHSHIIARSKRYDLSDNKDNVAYHCMICHTTWETVGERIYLDDYVDNMEYIKYVDMSIFRCMIADDYHYLKKNAKFLSNNFEYLKNEYEKL